MNGGSLKRHDTVAKGPWVWGLCSLDSGPGVGGANVGNGGVVTSVLFFEFGPRSRHPLHARVVTS